ncbi:putative divalent cation/proton antiporter TMEM165 [Equus asinus]|uniref:putative divalent cation/proton antiporter TMEM165 n=1 Tax=Equus asinus TaxID=9793 RepID=UPI00071A7C6E
MRGEDGHVAPSTGRECQVQWEEGASRTSTCPRTSRRRGGRRANGRPSRAGAGSGGLGWAALRQLAEPCGRRGREGGPSRRLRKPACLSLPSAPAPPAWCRLLSKRRRRGVRDAPRRRPGLEASRRPHFLLQCPCAAVAAGGMAAARGSGRASAPRLLLLLLFPLLWAPAGVRAVPEEDLSHRNKEPPAPAQQLQPQPAAGQGPEPARAEKGFTPAAPVHTNKEDPAAQTNLGFIHAFVAAISVIIVSELGDKTFFIAAIMAMRYNRLTVMAGAMLALGLMTCLSVLFGYATTVIPRVYTYYVSTALFAIFGIRMLREGLKMSPDEGQEELEEVQAELKKKDEEFQRTKLLNGPGDVETGTSTTIPQKKWLHFISPIFVQALTLTFLAEWGDRSQLTTIVLAAREDPYGVAVGGTVGHCLCTGLAVIGGRMIAQKISVRTVTIIGGVVFLAFAFSALFISPDSGF